MNVEDLKPLVTTTVSLSMDCPVCRKHRISVNISPKDWQWDGKTLTPSIRFEGGFRDLSSSEPHQTMLCKGHFTITNGLVNIEQ